MSGNSFTSTTTNIRQQISLLSLIIPIYISSRLNYGVSEEEQISNLHLSAVGSQAVDHDSECDVSAAKDGARASDQHAGDSLQS